MSFRSIGSNAFRRLSNPKNRSGLEPEAIRGKLGDRPPEQRMDPVTSHLGGRHQGERTFVKPLMGNDEGRARDDGSAHQKEIEIERSRAPPGHPLPIAAGGSLRLLARTEYVADSATGREHHGRVEEFALGGSHRLGPIGGRA